ncbi:MAG: F0F1 ATP synthase subunit delta [Pseudomonadota bacterium]
MLEKATIARPYAEAAFAQALDDGKLSEWSTFLGTLSAAVEVDEMKQVIFSPKVNEQELADFIADICPGDLSAAQKNFISILIEAERLIIAPDIDRLFEQSKAAAEGLSEIDVVSAYALNDAQLSDISDSVSKRIGKKVDINVTEDKELIGGVVIRLGDAVIDASIKGRLKELNNIFAQ